MDCRLPIRARPAVLAKHRTRLEGYWPVGELSRLAALCRSPEARIEAVLEFAFETGSNHLVMRMEVRGELELTCQRCLAAMHWRLQHANRIVVVESIAAAARLPHNSDPLLCPEGDIAPATVVEDEVLLALPQIPAHDSIGQCDAAMVARLGRNDGGAARDNPFGILRNIRL